MRPCRIRTGIFLQDIQLGGENIQVTFSCILDLDIVLDFVVHLDFFNSLVHAESVILMNDIIPDI